MPNHTPTTLDTLRAWFAGYCATFYSAEVEDHRNIVLKEEHTRRVGENMELLAASLSLDARESLLAAAIALFHDVGRFEQYRRFRTFKDSESINHAALGAGILREKGILSLFPEAEQELILRAIVLHNVFVLPADLDERVSRFVKLIRDADKLDIWRVFIEYYHQPEGERASAVALGFPDLPRCSFPVLRELREGRMVNLSLVETLNDFKLLQLSWAYDLNFPETGRLVKERQVLRLLAATLPPAEDVREAVAGVELFVDRCCG